MGELSEVEQRAVRILEVESPDDARIAEAMLNSITWGEGIEMITQESVQDFCWYRLPMKWMVEDEERHEMVAILARLFRHMGMGRYADICISETTTDVLHAYERSDALGKATFRVAEANSGISAPSTELLTWGRMMGPIEANARSSSATFLELAITGGELRVGERSWKKKQTALTNQYLTMLRANLDDRSLLEEITKERFERWLKFAQRSQEYGNLVAPLVETLQVPVPSVSQEVDPVAPLRWLLEQIGDGLALTQTGNCNRAFVIEASRHFDWLEGNHGYPPNNENDLWRLTDTRRLAHELGLTRNAKKSLKLTPKGRLLVSDHDGLWRAAATKVLPKDDFQALCGELLLAAMLGAESVSENSLHTMIEEIAAGVGWRNGDSGEPLGADVISWSLHPTADRLISLCAVQFVGPWRERDVQLTQSGRALAMETLRLRTVAPRIGPFG